MNMPYKGIIEDDAKLITKLEAEASIFKQEAMQIIKDSPKEIPQNRRKSAIDEAHGVIYGEREKTYGDPGKNIRVIADYWSTHLSATYKQNIRLTANDVCVMMVLLKQARQANTPGHHDSIVDTIGYAALQDRINSAADVPVVTEVVPVVVNPKPVSNM